MQEPPLRLSPSGATAHPLTPAHLGHLVRRWWSVVWARPLRPREQQHVAQLLTGAEAALFWDQDPVDQRHGYQAAATVQRLAPARSDLVRAALLHDVGKRHARLGWPGRVAATLAAMAGWNPGGRLGRYLDHARLGAADLAAAGADELTVAFALHHGGSHPGMIGESDWAVLRSADG